MTIATLIKNIPYVQGIVTVSVWKDGEEIERVQVESDCVSASTLEAKCKGVTRLHIKYMFARYDELVIEADGDNWKK